MSAPISAQLTALDRAVLRRELVQDAHDTMRLYQSGEFVWSEDWRKTLRGVMRVQAHFLENWGRR
jgi:hypothetical protein